MRRGVKVEGITLQLFGGVSRFSSESSSAGAQAWITFVGPLTSLVLDVVFFPRLGIRASVVKFNQGEGFHHRVEDRLHPSAPDPTR